MITLYGFGPAFGLPEASAYVTKTEIQLQMAGLSYRLETGGYERAPKGKLPFIDDDGEIVCDSTFIRAHVERKYGLDLDAGLSRRQRAEAWAVERMLEDHLAWSATHFRWVDPVNFAKGPAHLFDDAPEEIRDAVRRDVYESVRRTLHDQGIGRHTADEIAGLGGRSLAALAALLGDRTYLMGERPSGVDATAAAILAAVSTPFFETPLRARVAAFPNLAAYLRRMMRRHYPDHPWEGGDEAASDPAGYLAHLLPPPTGPEALMAHL